MQAVAIALLGLLAFVRPQQPARRCVSVPGVLVTVAALRTARCPGGRLAYLGDTVRISGRVTMGTGDLSRRVLHIIVQDSSGGITVVGPTGSGPWVAGDSVEVRGVLVSFRDALALDGQSITQASARRTPTAPRSIALSRDALRRADGRFVQLTGRVTGRGGEPPVAQLFLAGLEDTVATITVETESAGQHALDLDRFDAGDVVTVTGALIGQRSARDSTQRSYQLFPRGSSALTHVGLSRANRRALLWAALAGLLVMLAAVVAMRRRSASHRQALVAQREWFAALTDHAADYVLVLDARGRVTFASRAVERILGVKPEDLVGTDSLDHKDPVDRATVMAAFQRVLENPGLPVVAEYRAQHRDGRLVMLSGTARNMLRDPAVRGIVVNVRDISAERRIAAELLDAERQSREILDSLPVMVYSIRALPPITPIYVSRGHETLGYSYDEWMVPGLWERLVHPDDRERVLREIELARERREPLVTEYRVRDKHGRLRWLVDRGRFTFGAEGAPVTWQGVMIDVTAQHEAERALRESEERYRELFNEDVAANFVSSPSGRLITCNEHLARLLGFASVEDALRVDIKDLYETPDAREASLRMLRRDGRFAMHELRLRRVDGTIVNVLENARVRLDERGEITEIRGHLLDVTERRRLEAQLRQSQKMEAIGRLAGGIAHDFNNLLGIIGNYASVLREGVAEGSQQHADLDEIVRAVDRGALLTRQLLTFSRERPPEVTLVDIDAAIGDADRMLRRLLGPEIRLTVELHAEGARVRMDRGHADQILVNLLLNAADAMPDGGPLLITTSRVSAPPSGTTSKASAAAPRAPDDRAASPCVDYVRIEVRDAGRGMDAETARRAADPFFTTKALGHGTGLGLSQVYGIVKEVAGEFSIESEPGKGTAVSILLPVADSTRESALIQWTAPAASPAGGPKPVRTLLVDDEAAMLKSLGRILMTRADCTVTTASDGHEALKAWEEHAGGFDLLVTDLRMPGMGGEALIRELRARGSTVKVLAMSGYPEDQSKLSDLLDSNMRFMEKPYSLATVISTVQELTGGQ
jgi:PAS domain S-box-containing protein